MNLEIKIYDRRPSTYMVMKSSVESDARYAKLYYTHCLYNNFISDNNSCFSFGV
jgi:ribosome-binding factor A